MRLIPLTLLALVCAGGCVMTYKENYVDKLVVNPIPTEIKEGQYDAGDGGTLLDMAGMKVSIPSGGIADTIVLTQTNNDGTDQDADVDATLDATVTPGGQ